MDPDTGDGGTQADVDVPGTPVTPTRVVAGCAGVSAGKAPKTVDAATTRATSTRTPMVTGDAGTPRHNDKGSAVPVTTKKQQKGTGTKAGATENARIAGDLPTRGPAYQGTCLPRACHPKAC